MSYDKASESVYRARSAATAAGTRRQLVWQGLALFVVLQDAQSLAGIPFEDGVGDLVARLRHVADSRV